jgi:hypothetical protein
VRNEFGELVSYKEKGLGGQIVKEYDKGRAVYNLDYEGNRTVKYEYDEHNMLTKKIDMYENTTYYDKNQNPDVVKNKEGIEITKYKIYI